MNSYSVVPSGVYSVPDVRLARQGFYGERPTSFIKPGLPITPVNMLPYQGGAVPYGYTLVPNSAVLPQQRLMMVQPGSRTSYSVVDYDDEEPEEYVPIRPKKRSSDLLNEMIDSPEMDEFSAKTRQIRKDAESVLQRLNTSKPTSRASDFFKSYDYDRRPLLQRYPSPLPERSYARRSPYLDEDDEPLTTSSRRAYGTSLRPSNLTSMGLTKERIRSVYQDLEEPLTFRAPRTFDYSYPDTSYSSSSALRTPRDVARDTVQSEINRKAALKQEPPRQVGRSSSLRSTRIGQEATDVRNNISIRAHYAAMREAASRDVSIRKPKEIMP